MIDIVILNRNLRLHDNAALYYGSLNSNYIVIHLYDEIIGRQMVGLPDS